MLIRVIIDLLLYMLYRLYRLYARTSLASASACSWASPWDGSMPFIRSVLTGTLKSGDCLKKKQQQLYFREHGFNI